MKVYLRRHSENVCIIWGLFL